MEKKLTTEPVASPTKDAEGEAHLKNESAIEDTSGQAKAAIYLEEMYISGDTVIQMNHNLDELPEEEIGAIYLHDLLAVYAHKELEDKKKEAVAALEWVGEQGLFNGLSPDNIRRWHKMVGNSKPRTSEELYKDFKSNQ